MRTPLRFLFFSALILTWSWCVSAQWIYYEILPWTSNYCEKVGAICYFHAMGFNYETEEVREVHNIPAHCNQRNICGGPGSTCGGLFECWDDCSPADSQCGGKDAWCYEDENCAGDHCDASTSTCSPLSNPSPRNRVRNKLDFGYFYAPKSKKVARLVSRLRQLVRSTPAQSLSNARGDKVKVKEVIQLFKRVEQVAQTKQTNGDDRNRNRLQLAQIALDWKSPGFRPFSEPPYCFNSNTKTSYQACLLPSKNWECFDYMNDIESCGGCSVQQEGAVDCSALPNVERVSCKIGKCDIEQCSAGFELVEGACILKPITTTR